MPECDISIQQTILKEWIVFLSIAVLEMWHSEPFSHDNSAIDSAMEIYARCFKAFLKLWLPPSVCFALIHWRRQMKVLSTRHRHFRASKLEASFPQERARPPSCRRRVFFFYSSFFFFFFGGNVPLISKRQLWKGIYHDLCNTCWADVIELSCSSPLF